MAAINRRSVRSPNSLVLLNLVYQQAAAHEPRELDPHGYSGQGDSVDCESFVPSLAVFYA